MLEPNKGIDAPKRFIPEFQILQPVLHDDSEKMYLDGWLGHEERGPSVTTLNVLENDLS